MKNKYYSPLLFTWLLLSFTSHAQSYTINIIAGGTAISYIGDGGPATAAELYNPNGVAVDNKGNIYIADGSHNAIRMINSSGIISSVVGSEIVGGPAGYSGDGGPATAAELHSPTAVAADDSGNIYIADYDNSVIRKVNSKGIISTFAGNGTIGFSGDGSAANTAELNYPDGVAVNASGNVYISDYLNNRIRIVNKSGIISTIAGNGTAGFSGDGNAATLAELNGPVGIAIDASGNIYIGDAKNNRVRMVNNIGNITTMAGNGIAGYSGDGGVSTAAELNIPTGIAIDGTGNINIVDNGNYRIRQVNTSGIISTIAGNGVLGYSGDGGAATAAELYFPFGIATGTSNDIYFTDDNSIQELTITPTGINELKTDIESVDIYPNPANSVLTIEGLMENKPNEISIYDFLGNTIKQLNSQNSILKLDISDLTPGIYFVKINENTQRFIKQ